MASIINASTSGAGGVITTADNSGILQLQTASTTALTINSGQFVGVGVTPYASWDTTSRKTLELGSPGTGLAANPTNGNMNAQVNILTSATGNYAGITGYGLALNLSTTSGAFTFYNYGYGTAGATQTATPVMYIGANGLMTGYVANGSNSFNGGGVYQAYQYYRLNTAYTGTTATTAQSLLGVGVSLVGSMQYEFEIVVAVAKTAGTTSHTISLGFGGTATLNNIAYDINYKATNVSFTSLATDGLHLFVQTASATATTGAITTATYYAAYVIKGTVSINVAGTFIPQYTLSANPGGAYTTQIGSYMKISPIASSGANVSIGNWA